MALTVGSLVTSVQTDYSTYYAGTIAPGNVTLALPALNAGYLQVNLTQGGCDLRLYPANGTQWLLFNETGIMPPTWIGCSNRTTTTTAEVQDLILVNGGSSPGPYNVTVLAYSIETPYGWVALPGTALALAGLLVLVTRAVTERAAQLSDGFWEKKGKK